MKYLLLIILSQSANALDLGPSANAAGAALSPDTVVTAGQTTVGGQLVVQGSATVNGAGLTVNQIGGTADPFVVGASTFIIKNDGKVGVGTASPGSALEVNGAVSMGSGATKSTVSTTGALTMASDTNIVLTGNLGVNDTTPDAQIEILSEASPTGYAVLVSSQNDSTPMFSIDGNGDVGIGTGTASVPLEIQSSAVNGTVLRLDGSQYVGANNTKIAFFATNVDGAKREYANLTVLSDPSATALGSLTFGVTNGGADNVMQLYKGAVGIKAAGNPATRLHMSSGTLTIDGNGAAIPLSIDAIGTIRQGTVLNCTLGLTTTSTGAITGCVASDRKLKQAIKPMPYDDMAIDRLRPVFFQFSADPKIKRAGFIAQEVAPVLPRAVVPAGKDTLGVDPNAILAAVVSELQALRKRVEALERK